MFLFKCTASVNYCILVNCSTNDMHSRSPHPLPTHSQKSVVTCSFHDAWCSITKAHRNHKYYKNCKLSYSYWLSCKEVLKSWTLGTGKVHPGRSPNTSQGTSTYINTTCQLALKPNHLEETQLTQEDHTNSMQIYWKWESYSWPWRCVSTVLTTAPLYPRQQTV